MTRQAGSAIAETAVATTAALLIIYNAVQLSLLGFNQLHADASAFTAARVMAQTGNATTAQTAATTNLPPALDSYTISTPSTTIAQAITTKAGGGVLFLPGTSGTVTVRGEHQEPVGTGAATGFSFSFGIPTATLPNFYAQNTTSAAAHTTPATYSIAAGLAHNLNLTGTGQGVNGVFAEWQAHQQCYAALIPQYFPNSYVSTQTNANATAPLAQYTTFPTTSAEHTIYGWDTPAAGNGNGNANGNGNGNTGC